MVCDICLAAGLAAIQVRLTERAHCEFWIDQRQNGEDVPLIFTSFIKEKKGHAAPPRQDNPHARRSHDESTGSAGGSERSELPAESVNS